MSVLKADSLLLCRVNRPEYVSAPEGLLTSLAWNLFEMAPMPNLTKKAALVYRGEARGARTLEYFYTSPTPAKLPAWSAALNDAGLVSENDQGKLGRAVADAVAGVVVPEGKSRAATPMSPNLALLQNLRGMLGKAGPPEMGLILEQLYLLGAPNDDGDPRSAADRWLTAAEQRMRIDELVRMIDVAAASLFPAEVSRRSILVTAENDLPPGSLSGTPFWWFHQTWNRLAQDEWVRALPARVWVDWANTILRLAVGLGFMWEAIWFENIARSVLSGRVSTWEELTGSIREVIPWAARESAVSVRNVAPRVAPRIKRASLIRKELMGWMTPERGTLGLTTAMSQMAEDTELLAALRAALTSETDAGRLVAEAVKYSLMTRETSGPFADHFGLLMPYKTRSIYFVDPAPAWIAVIASLCCPEPGGQTTLGTVQRSLADMGLRPTRDDLVSLLERAGMTRGSADADQGLIVKCAY